MELASVFLAKQLSDSDDDDLRSRNRSHTWTSGRSDVFRSELDDLSWPPGATSAEADSTEIASVSSPSTGTASSISGSEGASSCYAVERRATISVGSGTGTGSGGHHRRTWTRRNAWGNLSYAELIAQAINSTPDRRMTLAQIYEWIIENVNYFSERKDNNSSAGWKNSIRHNLSLHSRFKRIVNEGTGKSSWWIIDPDAPPMRTPRRRAMTMLADSALGRMHCMDRRCGPRPTMFKGVPPLVRNAYSDDHLKSSKMDDVMLGKTNVDSPSMGRYDRLGFPSSVGPVSSPSSSSFHASSSSNSCEAASTEKTPSIVRPYPLTTAGFLATSPPSAVATGCSGGSDWSGVDLYRPFATPTTKNSSSSSSSNNNNNVGFRLYSDGAGRGQGLGGSGYGGWNTASAGWNTGVGVTSSFTSCGFQDYRSTLESTTSKLVGGTSSVFDCYGSTAKETTGFFQPSVSSTTSNGCGYNGSATGWNSSSGYSNVGASISGIAGAVNNDCYGNEYNNNNNNNNTIIASSNSSAVEAPFPLPKSSPFHVPESQQSLSTAPCSTGSFSSPTFSSFPSFSTTPVAPSTSSTSSTPSFWGSFPALPYGSSFFSAHAQLTDYEAKTRATGLAAGAAGTYSGSNVIGGGCFSAAASDCKYNASNLVPLTYNFDIPDYVE